MGWSAAVAPVWFQVWPLHGDRCPAGVFRHPRGRRQWWCCSAASFGPIGWIWHCRPGVLWSGWPCVGVVSVIHPRAVPVCPRTWHTQVSKDLVDMWCPTGFSDGPDPVYSLHCWLSQSCRTARFPPTPVRWWYTSARADHLLSPTSSCVCLRVSMTSPLGCWPIVCS